MALHGPKQEHDSKETSEGSAAELSPIQAQYAKLPEHYKVPEEVLRADYKPLESNGAWWGNTAPNESQIQSHRTQFLESQMNAVLNRVARIEQSLRNNPHLDQFAGDFPSSAVRKESKDVGQIDMSSHEALNGVLAQKQGSSALFLQQWKSQYTPKQRWGEYAQSLDQNEAELANPEELDQRRKTRQQKNSM